jgi:hypothetical protein
LELCKKIIVEKIDNSTSIMLETPMPMSITDSADPPTLLEDSKGPNCT